MILWFVFVMAWWLAGWKAAVSLLLTALAVESVWWVRQWRQFRNGGNSVCR